MDDFKNENINGNDNQNNGSISGFDSAENTSSGDGGNYGNGYTVTPDGGFYNKTKDDIIQDSLYHYDEPKEAKNDNEPTYSYEAQSGAYTQGSYPVPPVSKTKRKQKRTYSAAVIVVSVVLAAIVAAISSAAVVMTLNANTAKTVTQLPSVSQKSTSTDKSDSSDTSEVNLVQSEDSSEISSALQTVAAKSGKSVVGIRTTTSVNSFFSGSSESTGEGSGVVYTADGYIVTNYHVISGATSGSKSKIEVFFDNCNTQSFEASVVGYNIASDLAVIKINATGLTPADFGDSSVLAVGQYVITIGAPGGLEFMGSVTYGIISGLNRQVSSSSGVGLIQTDAAINPGNSGGALLDTSGKLIGINSSKIVSEEFEGMGFAIPVNTVIEVCNNIINNKGTSEPYVGITVSEKYTAELLESYGYPKGAVVSSVAEGSPAEDTGISRGDIITEFNGVKITDYTVYTKTLAKCKPGDTVSLKLYRNGRNYTAKIKIASNTVS